MALIGPLSSVRAQLAAPTNSPPLLACFEPELRDYDQLLEVGT